VVVNLGRWEERRDTSCVVFIDRSRNITLVLRQVNVSTLLPPGSEVATVTLTRDAFDAATADLVRRLRAPIDAACEQAGVALGDVPPAPGKWVSQWGRYKLTHVILVRVRLLLSRSLSHSALGALRWNGLRLRNPTSLASPRFAWPLLHGAQVGGATRMPAVRQLVKDVSRLEPLQHETVDPDVAVAMGAALYAGILDGVVSREMDVVEGLYTWP
jgi:heat shock protein 1/8